MIFIAIDFGVSLCLHFRTKPNAPLPSSLPKMYLCLMSLIFLKALKSNMFKVVLLIALFNYLGFFFSLPLSSAFVPAAVSGWSSCDNLLLSVFGLMLATSMFTLSSSKFLLIWILLFSFGVSLVLLGDLYFCS
jgi:hypothetical protein